MTKVSTNAGKHPYRRSDFVSPYKQNYDKPGLPLVPTKAKFKTVIDTEYKDKKGKKIFFRDVIIYNKGEYKIDYDAKQFYWVACSLKKPEKALKLSQIAGQSIISINHNKT
jgi:hypothetical protein